MSPMVWVIILVACLVIEIINMECIGVCGAVGAIAGLIVNAKGLNVYIQVIVAVVFAFCMMVGFRPIGLKYINRIKKEGRMQDLVGKDAIVVAAIDNASRTGVISVAGKNWSAKSHRPNAVIPEGQVVRILAMQKDVAIVDDRKRNRS